MDHIASAPVARFLADLSDPESGVGTGSAAAVVGAIAASALQAVARASAGKWPDGAGAAAQVEALSDRLAPLADENALAYRRARAATPVRGDRRFRGARGSGG